MAQGGATSFWDKVQDLIFPHLFSDLTVAGIIYWITGKQKDSTVKDAPYIDVRGELLADLLPRNTYPNLWRRHGEASVAKTENRFVTLLAKVPKRPVDLRKTVFPALEAMSDQEFNQALEELHHDRVWEFLQLVALHASPVFKAAWEAARKVASTGYEGAKKVDVWLAQRARTGTLASAPSLGLSLLKIVAWGLGLPFGLIVLVLIILRIVR